MDETKETAELYVIYSPEEGYITGKSTIRFTKHFEKARIFNRDIDARNSVRMWAGLRGKIAYIVPIQATLDKKNLFKMTLEGPKTQ